MNTGSGPRNIVLVHGAFVADLPGGRFMTCSHGTAITLPWSRIRPCHCKATPPRRG